MMSSSSKTTNRSLILNPTAVTPDLSIWNDAPSTWACETSKLRPRQIGYELSEK